MFFFEKSTHCGVLKGLVPGRPKFSQLPDARTTALHTTSLAVNCRALVRHVLDDLLAPLPVVILSDRDNLARQDYYYVATQSTEFFEMRPLCLAQGRLSLLRIRGSILHSPTTSSATASGSSASPSSTLFCCRIGRKGQTRNHTSAQWQKLWQKQQQRPWEEKGQKSGQKAGQESGQTWGQRRPGSRRQQQGWQWTVPPHRGRAPLLAAAQATGALGTAAFVKLSENEEASGDTGEQRMLQASRKEIAKKVDNADRGLSRLRHKVVFFLDVYVWEPLCTGFRFLHLALIFVPVILAVPAIWMGRRRKDRNNERSGTLWWYGFLVTGMEWAGPAFIKVRTTRVTNFRAWFESQVQNKGTLSGNSLLRGSPVRSKDTLGV